MTRECEEKLLQELQEFGEDIASRKEKIVEEWRADPAHKNITRGEINTPEMKALRAEFIRRYREILAKYKDK